MLMVMDVADPQTRVIEETTSSGSAVNSSRKQPESAVKVVNRPGSFGSELSPQRLQTQQYHHDSSSNSVLLLNHQRVIQEQLRAVQSQLQLLKRRIPTSHAPQPIQVPQPSTNTGPSHIPRNQTQSQISNLLVLRLIRLKDIIDQASRVFSYDHEAKSNQSPLMLSPLLIAPHSMGLLSDEQAVEQLEKAMQRLLEVVEDMRKRQTTCLQQSVAKLQAFHASQWQQATCHFVAEINRLRAKHKQHVASSQQKLATQNQSMERELEQSRKQTKELEKLLEKSRNQLQQSQQQLETLSIRCEVAETEKRSVLQSLEMREKAMKETVDQLEQSNERLHQRLQHQEEDFAEQSDAICCKYEAQVSQLQEQLKALEDHARDPPSRTERATTSTATATSTTKTRSVESQTQVQHVDAQDYETIPVVERHKATVSFLERRCAALERLLNKKLLHLASDQLVKDRRLGTRRTASLHGSQQSGEEPEREQSSEDEEEEMFSWEVRSEDSFDAVKREFQRAQPSAKPPPSPHVVALLRQVNRITSP